MRRLMLALVLAFPCAASAQTASQTASPPAAQPVAAAAQPTGTQWDRVEALKPGKSIYIRASTRKSTCHVQAVTADTITCRHGVTGTIDTFERTDITTIKLAHAGRSTLIGAGIGAATGAIIGYASSNSNPNNILSRGDVAIIFAVPLAVIGALIGFFTDFARTTLYRSN